MPPVNCNCPPVPVPDVKNLLCSSSHGSAVQLSPITSPPFSVWGFSSAMQIHAQHDNADNWIFWKAKLNSRLQLLSEHLGRGLKTKLWQWELDVSTGFPGSNLPSVVGSTEMRKCEKSLKTGIICRAAFDKAAP